MYLVAASNIATLGIPGKVSSLEKDDLKSSTEIGNTDGEIIIRKIQAFLNTRKLPDEKKNLIIRTLSNTLLAENINKVKNGESQLKRIFTKIIDDLGIYYKIGLTTDFTGKLDYISLTDILKSKDGDFFISDWLRNRNTVEFLGAWK